MSIGLRYLDNLQKLLSDLQEREIQHICQAGNAIATAIKENKMIHVFGTGHSHMIALEVFYRAGGLVSVNPILDEGLMLHAGAAKSTELERLDGYAEILFREHDCQPGDVMIIASNSGRNTVSVEMALETKKHNLTVIVITSLNHSKVTESRHSSGLRLHEVADIVVDNQGCLGDASVTPTGKEYKVAPTSTVLGAAIINAMVAEAIELVIQAGGEPDVFMSSNVDGGDAKNNEFISKYKSRIKSL